VLDAADYATFKKRPDCEGSVTDEARRRREMYREQISRQKHEKKYLTTDYNEFLRECCIVLELRSMGPENLQRVHELAQRTNQLNFSGNRYDREELICIMNDPSQDAYVLDCHDKFGRYGTVGFCVVDREKHRLIDLAFSCRIQNKRVEHAFLTYLLREYRQRKMVDFLANYCKTERNAPQGRVFDDLGFEILEEHEGMTTLMFPVNKEIVDEQIVDLQSKLIEGLSA
ncbi:MAG: hypothetical protein ACR2NU_00790, partial [Aeoliella sp.]